MQQIALPRCHDLGGLAETIGSLEALLPRMPCPSPDEFIRRGEIGTPGHFFYGPRFPLGAGRYLIRFWLRARGDASSPRLVFEAVAWQGDSSLSLGRYVTALNRGVARTVIYPLWIDIAAPQEVELRGWSDANSSDFRALGVDIHRVAASPATQTRAAAFRLPWRRPRAEGFANARPDFVELWLAFPPRRREAAQITLSRDRQPASLIEIPDPTATAPFALADGRLLLSLGFPAEAVALCRATVSAGGRTIDLGTIEIPNPAIADGFESSRRKVPQLDAGLASLEEPSPGSIEVIAAEGHDAAANENEVAIVERWSDFPLAPAERDPAMVVGRFLWDASGLTLRHGFARFPAGRFPALCLGCGPSGGSCTIRHRNRDIALDLHATEPGFLLVFPTLPEPVMRAEPGKMAAGAIHPAFEHMFRRLRGSWIEGADNTARDADG